MNGSPTSYHFATPATDPVSSVGPASAGPAPPQDAATVPSPTHTPAAYPPTASRSDASEMSPNISRQSTAPQPLPPKTIGPGFDILDWHPAYQSCQRYFLNHSQHEPATQALCALINIRLPVQWRQDPVASFFTRQATPWPSAAPPSAYRSYARSNDGSGSNAHSPASSSHDSQPATTFVSLVPYIRRLVVTGFDKPGILHGLFGDDYQQGVIPHVDCERRNYLFAAKHGGWENCKTQYDSGSGGGGCDETVPFMKPLEQATADELSAAEKAWTSWVEMRYWMQVPGDSGKSSSHLRESLSGSGFEGRASERRDH